MSGNFFQLANKDVIYLILTYVPASDTPWIARVCKLFLSYVNLRKVQNSLLLIDAYHDKISYKLLQIFKQYMINNYSEFSHYSVLCFIANIKDGYGLPASLTVKPRLLAYLQIINQYMWDYMYKNINQPHFVSNWCRNYQKNHIYLVWSCMIFLSKVPGLAHDYTDMSIEIKPPPYYVYTPAYTWYTMLFDFNIQGYCVKK